MNKRYSILLSFLTILPLAGSCFRINVLAQERIENLETIHMAGKEGKLHTLDAHAFIAQLKHHIMLLQSKKSNYKGIFHNQLISSTAKLASFLLGLKSFISVLSATGGSYLITAYEQIQQNNGKIPNVIASTALGVFDEASRLTKQDYLDLRISVCANLIVAPLCALAGTALYVYVSDKLNQIKEDERLDKEIENAQAILMSCL